MRTLCAVGLPLLVSSLALTTGCSIGDDPPTGDEHPDDKPVEVTGMITEDTIFRGTMRLTGVTSIAPMVTVTVEPGTVLEFEQAAGLRVEGGFLVNGTRSGVITAKPAPGATQWGPIEVSNGFMRIEHADFTGGQLVTTGPLASLEILDTRLYKASGDYIIMDGGNLNVQYSQLGPNEGETDTTHCQLHINVASTVSVIRSNIAGAPYGLMFYGGVGSNFQLNNWYGNDKDIDTKSGVEGNFSYGWFEAGAPTPGPGAQLTLENLATTRITQAGPRR